MGALLGGIVFAIIGVVLMVIWKGELVSVLKGSVPLMLALGGILAIIAGITSIKDSIEAKKLEQESQKETPPEQPEQK
ncbi:membrane protein [sediment metagenome]|uniref:Membrane protein n=1 Tax=sediment metagenome TaxID=749907 RepID=D9PN26_9ZZZZ